jgi:hypothetical protein
MVATIPPVGIVQSMTAGAKLATYGLVLAAAFGAGAAIGAAVGPDRDEAPAPAVTESEPEHDDHGG